MDQSKAVILALVAALLVGIGAAIGLEAWRSTRDNLIAEGIAIGRAQAEAQRNDQSVEAKALNKRIEASVESATNMLTLKLSEAIHNAQAASLVCPDHL